jgi:hypothetical protein
MSTIELPKSSSFHIAIVVSDAAEPPLDFLPKS